MLRRASQTFWGEGKNQLAGNGTGWSDCVVTQNTSSGVQY